MGDKMGELLRKVASVATVALALAGLASEASAATFSFRNISANNVVDANIGEAQLFVDVLAVAGNSNQVDLRFRNIGPAASSITDIYFDDDQLITDIVSITDSGANVSFSEGANPGHLPSENSATPNFVTNTAFTADSNSPAQPNGVNPDEFVTLRLAVNGTITTVIDELMAGLLLDSESDSTLNTFRIGIHVQGFAGGGSESFINGVPITAVPLPGVAVAGAALMGAVAMRRRRRAVGC